GVPCLEFAEAATGDEALELIERFEPDLLLLEVRLSDDPCDRGGLELLRRLRTMGRDTAAVMVTSITEIAGIRHAMRLGAQDYVFKDELWPEMLVPIVEGIRERILIKGEVVRLRQHVDQSWGTRRIVGHSQRMERVRKLVERLADAASTVLIRGETG